MRHRPWLTLALFLMTIGFVPTFLFAQDGEYRRVEAEIGELTQTLEGLEHGIVAMERLGRERDRAHLQEIAQTVREKIRKLREGLGEPRARADRGERDLERRRIQRMRSAFEAILAAGRRDAAELLEHAIHARKLEFENRRDEEAMEIRNSAPDLGAQTELLLLGAELLHDRGKLEIAEALYADAQELRRGWERERERERENDREVDLPRERLDALRREIRMLRHAHGILAETHHDEIAELTMNALRAREVTLEGRRDREAQQIRERAPDLANTAEALIFAAHLFAEHGREEASVGMRRLAEEFLSRHREQGQSRESSHASGDRIRDLEARVAHIERLLEEIVGHIRDRERKMRDQEERPRRERDF